MVIAEAAYLIDRQLGARAEASLYDSILSGQLEVASLDREDWHRIAELVSTYASLRLGGTDASLVAVAERLGTTRIATLNQDAASEDAGQAVAAQLTAIIQPANQDVADLTEELAELGERHVLADFTAADPQDVWDNLAVSRRRQVVATLMTVTVCRRDGAALAAGQWSSPTSILAKCVLPRTSSAWDRSPPRSLGCRTCATG
jgi:PIN domain